MNLPSYVDAIAAVVGFIVLLAGSVTIFRSGATKAAAEAWRGEAEAEKARADRLEADVKQLTARVDRLEQDNRRLADLATGASAIASLVNLVNAHHEEVMKVLER